MKFFWWYAIGFISIMLISSLIVSHREEFIDGSEGSNNQLLDTSFANANKQMSDNSFVEYHMSEDQLRNLTQHKLKSMNMIDENGIQVTMDFEPTHIFPVYYTPGSFLYSTSAFVPSYEESVKLSEVKPLLKRDIDPLKWSWSAETNRQPDVFNIGKPIDLKPILKEDIPVSGILSTGYFVLKKSKTINKFQMGMIPEGYYIYDDSNMAQIPPGFQASVDKMYISRKTDSTISRYEATDLSSY